MGTCLIRILLRSKSNRPFVTKLRHKTIKMYKITRTYAYSYSIKNQSLAQKTAQKVVAVQVLSPSLASEHATVQDPLVGYAVEIGWAYLSPEAL